ncbi:MAG: serine dehydratase subunit alpha family protein, partial [Spirochaetales bacterium]
MEIKDVVRLLKSEMIPAMGCTEPAASALAGAKARELIGDDLIKSIAVFASRDIVKNAMGVGIPDCERRGILTAVALGIAKGDS